ncbi:hypothetical protein BDW66DRAFT_1827 [Aspergillus desertorum]
MCSTASEYRQRAEPVQVYLCARNCHTGSGVRVSHHVVAITRKRIRSIRLTMNTDSQARSATRPCLKERGPCALWRVPKISLQTITVGPVDRWPREEPPPVAYNAALVTTEADALADWCRDIYVPGRGGDLQMHVSGCGNGLRAISSWSWVIALSVLKRRGEGPAASEAIIFL